MGDDAMIADLCPVHAIPMWHHPASGEWACQRVHCGETVPTGPGSWVRERWLRWLDGETRFAHLDDDALDAIRYSMTS